MIDYNTKNCIVCGEEAELWSGHVHYKKVLKGSTDKDMVTAGFCKEHEAVLHNDAIIDGREDCEGCFGKWKKQDGLVIEEIK